MICSAQIRRAVTAAILAAAVALPVCAQRRQEPAPAVHQQPAPQVHENTSHQPASNAAPKNSGEHLAEWMRQHSELTPQQQQEALQKEPGFRDLPPATQQRMRDQISRLNSMPPQQRERMLERNEWMEHLTVDQRKQVRDATKQLADLPPDQRRYVARTFRGLRELSPAQRDNVLNSDRFNHLTPEQRASLNSLMKVEPLLPPPYDGAAPAQQPPH
jgi:hypothetical protein